MPLICLISVIHSFSVFLLVVKRPSYLANMKLFPGSRSGGATPPPGGSLRDPLAECKISSNNSLLSATGEVAKVFNDDTFEMNPSLLACNKDFNIESVRSGEARDQETGLIYKIYPKFEHKGEVFIWQANCYVDGHAFLSSLRKYCLDRFHVDELCLGILRTNARTILNVYQGYYRVEAYRGKLCKLKFLRHFVSRFPYELSNFESAVKRNALFVPHVSFFSAYSESRSCDNYSSQFIKFLTNWDRTKDFTSSVITDGFAGYVKEVAADYVDRLSILANIVHNSSVLYDVLVGAYKRKYSAHDILMAINSFYRSLDFKNEWANSFIKSLKTLFPSFGGGSKLHKVKELFSFLISSCSDRFKAALSFLYSGEEEEKDAFEDVHDVNEDGGYFSEGVYKFFTWERIPPLVAPFFTPHGPIQGIIDITESDLGFMTSKLTALVASFCALLTVNEPPEFSMAGLTAFSKKIAPPLMAAIAAGKFTTYLADLDKVLELMWQAADSIFKGDFGRFVGVDYYSQIFELYNFITSNYGGVAPNHHSLGFQERDDYVSPVTLRLPKSIIQSTDQQWKVMIDELEGRSRVGKNANKPLEWSEGMRVVAKHLNEKLDCIVGKCTLSRELKAKFANITTHLQSLTRSTSFAPPPFKAAGHSFIFTGEAGVGKSTQMGKFFRNFVINRILLLAYKYGYDDIGDWCPGKPIDNRLINSSRSSNFQMCRSGGISYLFAHAEDFDPIVYQKDPKPDNIHERIMSCADTVSANRDAAALTSNRGDGVKGDNYDRCIANFFTENRADAGIRDIAVNFPAACRRVTFVRWHLKAEYADSFSKLDLNNEVVNRARDASDTANIYNLVTVYSFARLCSATGEYEPGESMNEVPVYHTFVSDQSYGVGRDKVEYRKGQSIALKKVSVNAFYCYMKDLVDLKYDRSFREWRDAVTRTQLKEQGGRCLCPEGISLTQCCKCAGPSEFNPLTGNLTVLCPYVRRNRGQSCRNISSNSYGSFEERSILEGMKKVDYKVLSLFRVMVESPTLRPVTRAIFSRFDVMSLMDAHKEGKRWTLASNSGPFVEHASLDHLIRMTSGTVRQSPAALEEWWSKSFDPGFSLGHAYFLLLRYLTYTPSVYCRRQDTANAGIIEEMCASDFKNQTVLMLYKASYAAGVDANGLKLSDRLDQRFDDSPESFAAQATMVSLAKIWIFMTLLDVPNASSPSPTLGCKELTPADFLEKWYGEIEHSNLAFLKPFWHSNEFTLFQQFDTSSFEYMKDFVSVFCSDEDILFHEQLVSYRVKNLFPLACADVVVGKLLSLGAEVELHSGGDADVEMSGVNGEGEPYSDALGSECKASELDLGSELSSSDGARVHKSYNGCCEGLCYYDQHGDRRVYHDISCRLCRSVNASRVRFDLRFGESRLSNEPLILTTEEAANGNDLEMDEPMFPPDLANLPACPEWCTEEVWTANYGHSKPMYFMPAVSAWNWSFYKFLRKIREHARASRFIAISPTVKRAVLLGLAPVVGTGALYVICKSVLNRGKPDSVDFEPHGMASTIPAGQGYWDEDPSPKFHTASAVNKSENTTAGSHGRNPQSMIATLLGRNVKDKASRIVKVTVKRKGTLYGIMVDNNTLVMPSHAFASCDFESAVEVKMETLVTVNQKWVSYVFEVTRANIYFSEISDVCRIYHGVSGLSINPLNCWYKSFPDFAVDVDATYVVPSTTEELFSIKTGKFTTEHRNLSLHGPKCLEFPDQPTIMSHLRKAPIENCYARYVGSSSSDDYERVYGECGLPCVMSAGRKHPTLGFYIGSMSPPPRLGPQHQNQPMDQYETYVAITEDFMVKSQSHLYGVEISSSLGVRSNAIGSFQAHMDFVNMGFEEKDCDEKLADAIKVSSSNIRYGKGEADFHKYMLPESSGFNCAQDTEIFRYSGSKSGIHVSLPSFDQRKVKGIYPSHEGVKGVYPIIGSENDIFFYPELLHLGVAPWAGEEPHYTFGGELIFGMVGPGEESANGSKSSMGLSKEVAKSMIHAHIPIPLIKDASSRLLDHYLTVIKGLLKDDDFPHADVERLLVATVEEQFVGVKREDGEVIMPKMDHTSSWGSNNKPKRGSNKSDVYTISEDGELFILPGAEPAWEAFTAALYCLTCGVVPANQFMTCFTKRECYPVTGSSDVFSYNPSKTAQDFYASFLGMDKARELLDLDPSEDQKMRDIFHSVPGLKVKVKSRLVSNLPGSVNVGFRMFFLPISFLLMRFPIEFDMVAGLDMGSIHYEQSTNQIFHDGFDPDTGQHNVFDADVSAWDKIMPAALTRHTLMIFVQLVFELHKYYGTYNSRLVKFSEALMSWWDEMILYYGGVMIPIAVMPSGFVMTLPMNSAMNQLLAICNVLHFAKKKGIPPPLSHCEWIRHKALGDDSQTAIKPAFVRACKKAGVDVYSAVEFSEIMHEFGIHSTLGDKSDGDNLRYQHPGKLVFLQHVMTFKYIPAYTLEEIEEDGARINVKVLVGAAPLKAPVLVKLLAKQDSKSEVLPKQLLRDQVFIVLFELVPYGRKRFDRFVDAVRNFQHPKWKPSDMNEAYEELFNWNYWLDRYVKKFCRGGKLDPLLVHQREANKESFESLKTKLNPEGIEALEYDPF